jgi:hypothetical protein
MYELEIQNSPVQYLYDKMVWISLLRERDQISAEMAEDLRQRYLKLAMHMERKRGYSEIPSL